MYMISQRRAIFKLDNKSIKIMSEKIRIKFQVQNKLVCTSKISTRKISNYNKNILKLKNVNSGIKRKKLKISY